MMHRIGAVLYGLWDVLHVAAAYETYRLALSIASGPALWLLAAGFNTLGYVRTRR